MPTDLQIAVQHLTAKKPRYDMLWQYYDAEHPLVYSSAKLKEIFHGLDARFVENWCAVVVDSVLDRMELRELAVADDEEASAALDTLREQSGLVDDEDAIHEDIAVTGEGFVIAWKNEDGTIEAFQNDSRLCHAFYDDSNPHLLRAAAKWWNEDGRIRLNLYYPDRIEYYATRRDFKEGETPTDKAFEPWQDGEPVVENPFGRLNVFHFRSNRRRVKSQLNDVLTIQDVINKTVSDLVVTGEFMAFPQRYVISESGIANLQNNPNAIWDLVAAGKDMQATQAGQFPAADLGNYLEVIRDRSHAMGVISRTPKHYFFAQGGDPSGEALIAMEAPLNKKVRRLQRALSPSWRDLGSFLLWLSGRDVPSQNIWANYVPPETVQPQTEATIAETWVKAGRPLRNVLRDSGWDDNDLAELDDDQQAERVSQASYADAVLTQAQRQFDAGSVA